MMDLPLTPSLDERCSANRKKNPEDWKPTILAAASTHTNQHRARSPGETDEKNFAPVSKTVPRGQPDVASAN